MLVLLGSALPCAAEYAVRLNRERQFWHTVVSGGGGHSTALLREGGRVAEAVGNIGTIITSRLAERQPGSWFVAELSSFQLATTRLLHPHVACLMNVTPDHVEWHGSMEAYAQAKEKIFANLQAGDLAVVSDGDDWCRAVIGRLDARGLRVCRVDVRQDPGTPCAAFVRDGRLVVRNAK